VDENPSVVESYGGYRVKPFGCDPWDEEFLKVPEAMAASEDRSGAPLDRAILTLGVHHS
jgi:hypothetical protein